MRRTPFGILDDGRPVECLVIGSEDVEVHLLDLGASVHRLYYGGRNVVLGYASAQDQYECSGYLGSTIGRYANRIAGGRFELDGTSYGLLANEGSHTLHGGPDGFHRQFWRVTVHDAATVRFELTSPDGDQGFPGNLQASVSYEVQGSTVTMSYTAQTDSPTIVNLTNHSYFNLDGESAGSISEHVLLLNSHRYTSVGPDLIPTGDLAEATEWVDGPCRLADVGPLDHNFVLDGSGMRSAATLTAANSGIELTVSTDQPGLQVYTGDYLDGSIIGTGGHPYGQSAGIALETQHFPDAPNQPGFPSVILVPGQTYQTTTRWTFSPHPAA